RRGRSMNELTVLAEMREDVPSDTRYPAAHRALMAEISGRVPARRRFRRPVLIGGAVAATVAVGAAAAVVNTGGDRTPSRAVVSAAPSMRLVAVTSPAALAANAATVAQHMPVPAPTQWVYVKLEHTISHAPPSGAMPQVPGTHQTTESWTRVDMLAVASVH